MLTGVAEAEAIGRAAKGEQPAVRFYGANEALEELADVLLHSELLHRREELQDKLEERLREAGDEALLGCAGLRVAGRVRVGMRDMAGSGFGGVLLGCDGHGCQGGRRRRRRSVGGEVAEAGEGGEREMALKGLALELIVQLTRAPAAQIGHNWIFIRSPHVVSASLLRPTTLPAASAVRTGEHDSL